MTQPAYCSYYGRLDGERSGYTIGESLVDEMYEKILEKHEARLVEDHKILIAELKKTFSGEIKKFKNSVDLIEDKLNKLERQFKKESKSAVEEREI